MRIKEIETKVLLAHVPQDTPAHLIGVAVQVWASHAFTEALKSINDNSPRATATCC